VARRCPVRQPRVPRWRRWLPRYRCTLRRGHTDWHWINGCPYWDTYWSRPDPTTGEVDFHDLMTGRAVTAKDLPANTWLLVDYETDGIHITATRDDPKPTYYGGDSYDWPEDDDHGR
jgi:hypothetical protein